MIRGSARRGDCLETKIAAWLDTTYSIPRNKKQQDDVVKKFQNGVFGQSGGELPVDFNGKLFHRLVDYATVCSDGRVVFTFRNEVEVGTEI